MRRAALALALTFSACVTTRPPERAPRTPPPETAAPTVAATPEAPADADAPAAEAPAMGPAEHLERGVAAMKAKEYPGAIEHLRACTEQAPDDVQCHWELGWAYYLASDWENVVAEWTKVKALQPDHPDVDGRLQDATHQLELQRKLEAMAKEAPPPVRAEPPEGVTLRLRAVGDVMLGTEFPEGYLPPEDGALMLAGVKDWMADADLTFANLEGPLCDTEKPSDKCRKHGNCYAFRSPTRYVKYLVEAGVDLASTANNHNGDFGDECRRQTEATLDSAGIKWSGSPGSIATVEKNGLKIALIAFHTSAGTNDVNDLPTAQALVKLARADHDLVIVSFHGGAEGAKAIHVPNGKELFFGENRGELRKFTHGVVDAGADLVLGHGPHVLRGMEVYKDHLIAYSLGNFATYGRFTLSGALGIGAVVEVIVDGKGRFVSGKVLPTRQVGEGVPQKDEKGAAIGYLRMLSREDFPGTGVVIDSEGGIGRPEPGKSAQR